ALLLAERAFDQATIISGCPSNGELAGELQSTRGIRETTQPNGHVSPMACSRFYKDELPHTYPNLPAISGVAPGNCEGADDLRANNCTEGSNPSLSAITLVSNSLPSI